MNNYRSNHGAKRGNLLDNLIRETDALQTSQQVQTNFRVPRTYPSSQVDPSRDPDTENLFGAPPLIPEEMATHQHVGTGPLVDKVTSMKQPDPTVSFPPLADTYHQTSHTKHETVNFQSENSQRSRVSGQFISPMTASNHRLRPISQQSIHAATVFSLDANNTEQVLNSILPFRAPHPSLPHKLEKKLPLVGPVVASQLVKTVFECKRLNSPFKASLKAKKVTQQQLIDNKIITDPYGDIDRSNISRNLTSAIHPSGEAESIFIAPHQAPPLESSNVTRTSLPALCDRSVTPENIQNKSAALELYKRHSTPQTYPGNLALTIGTRGLLQPSSNLSTSLATSPINNFLNQLSGERPTSRMALVKSETEKQWAINPLNKYSIKTTLLDGTVITTAAPKRQSPHPTRVQLQNSHPLSEEKGNEEKKSQEEGDTFSLRFENACDKVNSDLQQLINERLAEAGKIEAALYIVTRLTRPSWPRDGRRRKDFSGFTFSFKHHLRSLFRWAIGRAISQLKEQSVACIADAKSELAILRAAKKKRDEKQLYQSRVRGATALLEEVVDVLKLTRQQLKAREQMLNSESYIKLRRRFEFISGAERMVLSLFELQEMAKNSGIDFDVKLFRKIDLDRGGYLEFDEVVHSLYPTIPLKALRLLMRRYDEENGLESVWRKKIAVENAKAALMSAAQKRAAAEALVEEEVLQLTPESKEQINLLFHATDDEGKGYVTRENMINIFIKQSDQDDDAPLPPGPYWFDSKFPTPESVVGLDMFTEMVKSVFPPFKNVSTTFVHRAYKPPPASPIPSEIIEFQMRLVNKPGYVK